jgi:hypothetical protein
MRKLFFILMSCFMLNTHMMAKEPVQLSSHKIDNTPLGDGPAKSPVVPPCVYIEDYTLSFEAYHPDYALIIKDEDDNVVYTTSVWSSQTEVVLPSTLTGDYEINLVMGNWLFTGWISLNIGDY